MQLVSYAQNGEDILLWRALKNFSPGFYIDVGANDPVSDSVTKLFYERSWTGINVEPVADKLQRLAADRPRDINVGVLLGSRDGSVPFYEVVEDSRFSTLDRELALEYQRKLGYSVVERQIQMKTLGGLCTELGVGEIHFLKIDVEGGEDQVLAGLDLSKVRPWIIVVESTLPCSDVMAPCPWVDRVLGAHYHEVFFDGLSRYFLADERRDLKSAFRYPVGIHDSYVTHAHQKMESQIQQLRCEIDAVRAHYEKRLRGLLESRSWRITAPLRWLDNRFVLFFGKTSQEKKK